MKRPEAAPAAPTVQLVGFRVGPEEYALDIQRTREIINPLRITPIPKAPPFVEGVVELRGLVFPIVDLRKRFDLPATPATRATKYIVVEIAGRMVGLVVDAMTQLRHRPATDIRPVPLVSDGGGAAAEEPGFFSGVIHEDGRIIMIVDLDRLLTSQEKVSLARMTGGGGDA